MTVIAFDADEVLLQTRRAFLLYMQEQGAHPSITINQLCKKTNGTPPSARVAAEALFPGRSYARLLLDYQRFSHSESYGQIKPYPGAPRAVRQIRAEHPSARLVAVTAMGLGQRPGQLRRENLAAQFGIEDVVQVPFLGTKSSALKKLGAKILLDDNPAHATEIAKLGGEAILVHQPWNSGVNWPHRLKKWSEAPMLVRELLSRNKRAARPR